MRTVAAVFTASAAVGAAHFAVTGFEDVFSSVEKMVPAGWGALAMEVLRTFTNSASVSSQNGVDNRHDVPLPPETTEAPSLGKNT